MTVTKNESSYYPLLTESYGKINRYDNFVGIGGLHRDLSKIDILVENTTLHKENIELKHNRDTALEYLENMPAALWNEAHKYNYDFDKLFDLIKGDSDE